MFKSLLALFLSVTTVLAQNAVIGLPAGGQVVNPGSSLVVQVQRPNSLTGSEEVAVVVGFVSCPSGPCPSPTDDMGTISYNGPFSPQYHEAYVQPYQNFTVQVPSSAPQGTAQINVVHVALVGAGLWPLFETLNQTITIA